MPSSARILAGALAIAGAMTAQAAAQQTERHVYVTVLDQDGTPVSGLTSEHFAVRESGRDRAVVRAGPLDTAMHVAVILDTSFGPELPIESFRSAVGGFIERLAASHHVAIYTIAERAARVTPFTRDTTQLRAAVANMFARPDSRTYLLDTVDLALSDLRPLEPARPVLVAFTTENVEASTRTAGAVMKQLIARSTAFHAVQFATAKAGRTGGVVRDSGSRSVPERSQQLGRLLTEGEGDRERSRLIDEGTRLAAGSLQRIVSVESLDAPLLKLASEFAYSYRLTFAGPAADKPLRDLQIGLMVEGVTVRAIPAPDAAKRGR
jgi:VWFA-related protein